MKTAVAIVGMSCRYPEADSVDELFENSVAQRRAFREIPPERLPAEYFGSAPDRSYARQAALLGGFEFKREWFRIPRQSYEVTDLTHWLALTVAKEAIDDIRFRRSGGHPHNEAVRVVVANTLAGEFSRAGLMRLRWPYVRRIVAQHLRDEDPEIGDKELARRMRQVEATYKRPFPTPNEDSLAGGLANTIAGRICNHFDFKGGGYSVDGACASSLLAVSDACSALVARDADMVLAGGVDLSIDPFELVGFSRSAALAKHEMRVYDQRSEGFWPGEGCGFVALMRLEDAVQQCEHVHGVIHGWGISSDGRGGLTRPESEGQALALRRCYARAGYGIESVGYFEGHGTGTKVGDEAELRALIAVRRDAGKATGPAVISSIKANIGHTKAAAGLAGLLRATMCVREHVLPPTTACGRPHELLVAHADHVVPSYAPRAWRDGDVPRRAGISAMGFGGINAHIAIEEALAPQLKPVARPNAVPLRRLTPSQDAELFLFAASQRRDLAWTIDRISGIAGACSRSELTDLAVELGRRATRDMRRIWRAAVVASTPIELSEQLERLREQLAGADDDAVHLSVADGVFLSGADARGTIGLIFPGQGAPVRPDGGVHARRFDDVGEIYAVADLASDMTRGNTDFAQPAIVTASAGGIRMLQRIGAHGDVAVGHSLGELTALHWAGCFDATSLGTIARARGKAIVDDERTHGAMAAIAADREAVTAAIVGLANVVVANVNTPRQTVVSGDRRQVETLVSTLRGKGTAATVLGVHHAFHSPAMAAVAARFRKVLGTVAFAPVARTVISTVTGETLGVDTDLAEHLCDQLTSPVQFLAAAQEAAREVDLLVEVGAGSLMADLLGDFVDKPVISIDVGSESLRPFLRVAGATWVLGRAPAIGSLFGDRFARRFDWTLRPTFLQNPCEAFPSDPLPVDDLAPEPDSLPSSASATERDPAASASDELRRIIAEHTGLPAWTLEESVRMSSELHLNSITVSDIVIRLAVARGVRTPVDPLEYANASIGEIAAAVERLADVGAASGDDDGMAARGIGSWVRRFEVVSVPSHRPSPAEPLARGDWQAAGAQTPQVNTLVERLNSEPFGSGVLLWLSDEPGPEDRAALLSAAQRCASQHNLGFASRLVVVQRGWGAGGFARSFFLEQRSRDVLLINLPAQDHDETTDWIASEIAAAPSGFLEVSIDAYGGRHEPRIRLLEEPPSATTRLLDASDVVLVTGGGKGIAAECALHLAQSTGCALLVLGRSAPAADDELATNLDRLRGASVRVAYHVADVTDAAAVAAAVKAGVEALNAPVSGVIHGAGINEPRTVTNMTIDDLESTLAPKLDGLRNVLAAIDASRLGLLCTFSSIIARTGLRGEADYALSNEWLSHETELFQRRYPACRCRAIEWSVWSGTGMGQRLGRLDILERQGISPISIDDGVREFLRLVETPELPARIVVSGRFGESPTMVRDRPARGRFRFVDSVLVDYPGVEFIAQTELSPTSDLYLDDHVLAGDRLFPAVMALEAMSEAAAALLGREDAVAALQFRDVSFRAPIVVPTDEAGKPAIRIAALAGSATAERGGEISLAIRCSGTSFQINHVEARCVLGPGPSLSEVPLPHLPTEDIAAFDPGRSLYDNVLFQSGRFRRIAGYQMIEARRCSGRLSPDGATRWFARDLPQSFALGDAGARDAALHAIQACIPHKIVVPQAVGQIDVAILDSSTAYRMFAIEIADHGEELIYDLTILDATGLPVERWHRIVLRVIAPVPGLRVDSPALVAPLLERRVAAVIPEAGITVAIDATNLEQRSLEGSSAPSHRPDGKPESPERSRFRSASYTDVWRLTVDAAIPIGCDLETVAHRSDGHWARLLGEEGIQLATVIGDLVAERLDISATRVWTAREALMKAGLAASAPLIADATSAADWVVLRSGDTTVFSLLINGPRLPFAICAAAALVPIQQ